METVSKKDILMILTKIRLNFENAYKCQNDTEQLLLIESWHDVLTEYPRELVFEAVKQALKTAKFAPRLGDITEKIEEMREAYEKSDAELWAELTGVLREVERCAYSFKYTYVDESGMSQGDRARQRVAEIFNGLSPELKDYIRTQRELVELSQYTSDQMSYERGRFMRVMPQMRKNQRVRGQMTEGLKNLIQGLQTHLQIEYKK